MKYVEGQTVRVVSDRSSHGIADGTKVKITTVFQSPLHYGIRVEGGLTRYAREDELEGHAVALRKFKAGDKVLLNTTKPIRGSGSLPLSEGGVEGVVTGYDERDNDVIVSFPDHPRFYAVESELDLVGEVVEVQEPEQLVVGDVVRILTSRWEPEAPMNSLAIVVANGSIRHYYCKKGMCEIGFAQRNLGEKIEKVASAGEAIKGAVYRVLGNECRPRHNYAVGQLIRCTGVAKDDSGSDFVALRGSLRQYVHQSQLEFVAFTAEGLEGVVEAPKPVVVEAAPAKFAVGDKVRMIVEGSEPFYGQGEVEFGDIGTITHSGDDGVCVVDFPAQSGWMARQHELELVVEEESTKTRADRTTAPVYVVVHEERQEDFLIVTEDREEARRVKTRKGGKRAGYIINLYAKVKEIR